ncbi:TetR/AcrR family transcriptional regulator [uncultured Ruminococcus sp.]|uniref:TetR/AcrR family transcriptional regulator n=1 Tax=uncultured Ruminococcus sp. TaxID=165186 RepID=UPI0025F3E216|nr:TetR/AcrR family transcriptional regulator [uncultured Ruminococcus sp.]
MNEKFFALPKEKQNTIINAGYRVFSQNTYKKSPMSEIAGEADISKSQLFHYFHNKRELYLFLWNNCVKLTIKYLTEYKCYEQTDLFEMMYRGMKAKMRIMNLYPNMGSFVIKAFYERDPEISSAIQESYKSYSAFKTDNILASIDTSQFADGLDFKMMYREMTLASEGYLWKVQRNGEVDVEKMEKDFTKMLEFWKKLYLRKGGEK